HKGREHQPTVGGHEPTGDEGAAREPVPHRPGAGGEVRLNTSTNTIKTGKTLVEVETGVPVPGAGLEPARPAGQPFLSRPWLPLHHPGSLTHRTREGGPHVAAFSQLVSARRA